MKYSIRTIVNGIEFKTAEVFTFEEAQKIAATLSPLVDENTTVIIAGENDSIFDYITPLI